MCELEGRRFGVVGAGVGGLAAAAALQQLGAQVVAFEANPQTVLRGALLLWANAVKGLVSLGLEVTPEVAAEIDVTEVRTADGDVLSSLPIGRWSRASGAPSVVIRRPVLIDLLERALAPGTVQRGRRVVAFAPLGAQLAVRFADASLEVVDGLIGADGLGSTIRTQLLGPQAPRSTGQEAWVGVAPLRPPGVVGGVSVAAMGRGPRFWFAPLADGATFWYATRACTGGGGPGDGGGRGEVARTFAHWHAPIPELIAATPEHEIVHTRIRDHLPVARWGSGAVSLLGDAAHPCTPDLGQGACQAIESAAALGDAVRDAATIADGLRAYEQRRMQRTATIARLSWLVATSSTVEAPVLCWLRDTAIRTALGSIARTHLPWILEG